MFETYKKLISNQFEAALFTLHKCVEACPGDVWQAPVHNFKFSHVVFHTLLFTDFYLGKSEESFRAQQFHLDNVAFFNAYDELSYDSTETTPSKPEIEQYLSFCRNKMLAAIQVETDESLKGGTGFSQLTFSRAELYVYTIRHIQHHSAQLSLRLKREIKNGITWVKSGWN